MIVNRIREELSLQVYNIRKTFSWHSQKESISRQFYRIHTRNIDWDKPERFTDKLNWLKVYRVTSLHHVTADKLRARKYLAHKGLDSYIVPLLAVYKSEKEIKLEDLPKENFVIKTTHDGGHYFLVRDRNSFPYKQAIRSFKYWLKRNYYYVNYEMQYRYIKPRIIVERLLLTEEGRVPDDFKVHCFNGKVQFIYVSHDREGDNVRMIYNRDWRKEEFTLGSREKFLAANGLHITKPDYFDELMRVAEDIAVDFSEYVRVDFYAMKDRFYIGEITHHHGGGLDKVWPESKDFELGRELNLNPYL